MDVGNYVKSKCSMSTQQIRTIGFDSVTTVKSVSLVDKGVGKSENLREV